MASFLVFGNPTDRTNEGSSTFADVRDGVSNKLFFAERYGTCGSSGDVNAVTTYGSLWSDSNLFWLPTFCKNGSDAPAIPYEQCLTFQVAPDPLSECAYNRAQSPHGGGMTVGVGDGGVRFISGSVDPQLWAKLCDPRDGSAISGDW